jgi:Holliday junction resolvase RusA-like endonuclease
MTFEIKELPPTPNKLLGAHWSKRSKSATKWRDIVYWHTRIAKKSFQALPLDFAQVTMTRHSSSEPDFDGLVGSFKPILDALVSCGILLNDTMKHVEGIYRWKKCAPKQGKITVEVKPKTKT